jgi:WD40 repeat protein
MENLFSMNARFNGHQGSIYTLLKGDGSAFYSGSGDKLVVKWDVNTPDEGEVVARASDAVYAILLLKEENVLLVGQASGGIHVINLTERAEKRLLKISHTSVFSLHLSPDGKFIFVLTGDGSFYVIDRGTLDQVANVKISSSKVRSMVFNDHASKAYFGCGEGAVQEINLNGFTFGKRWQAHKQGFSVNTLVLSSDKEFLLTGSRDAHINKYSLSNYSLIQSVPAHNYAIYDLAFNPNCTYLASASRDKTVKIWNPETLEVVKRLEKQEADGHVNSVNKLLWLSDTELLSAGDDRSIALWKMSI